MAYIYHHLDEDDVRAAIVERWGEENEALVASGQRAECYGADLVTAGWLEWGVAMPEALRGQDDQWLFEHMSDPNFWRSSRPRRLKDGGMSSSRLDPEHAARTLCFAEFNIAYVRGVATALLARGESECLVYRAEAAYEPREECLAMEGRAYSLQEVLDGHRARYWPRGGTRPDALSIPVGFGCHHSICSTAFADRV